MSESTSTNISVAQAHSTESIHASSTQHSRMADPGSTKRIQFYKSGDPRFNGIKMVVSNRSFKTFDALLDNLSKKVPLPFGVRNITTPRGMHHITSLEELEDGKAYICSHQRKIKPINLERARKKPLLWQSSRPISARRRVVQLAHQNEVAPFKRENTIVIGSSKNFVIFKNGDKDSKYTLVLNRKPKQSFDTFLDQVSETLQFPVFKLYSTDGRRILSMHALLLSSGTIVAAGREPFKPGNYNSEREYLPPKLPGISQRVFPKARSKPDLKSRRKANEPLFTSPNGQEYSQSSANVSNKDDNLVEYSHLQDNEMCLTECWPHSGEEIPIISPGDNIEKTVHLNSDGTMTVEMKVRFKIRQEETINWSTTVSRADISYYKKRLFCSSVNPEIEAVRIRDSPTRSLFLDNKIHDECKDSMEFRYESNVEEQIDKDVDTNESKTSSSRKEKSNFYRPPTPGIRKSQERRASTRRTSEGNLQEHMKQMLTYQEIEHETAQSVDGIKNDCNTQMLTTADNVDSNGADLNQNSIDHSNAKHLSKLREDSFEILESTVMELSQRDTVYEKDVRKSLRNDYMCISGSSKQERPSSAGKNKYKQEQFRFKEIKRSMSNSVTYSEPSTLNEHTKHRIKDFGDTNKQCLDKGDVEHSAILMESVPANKNLTASHNSLCQPPSTLGDKTDRGSENETCPSNDSYCAPSQKQKKKKKKKTAVDQANIPNCNSIALDSQNIESQHLMNEVSCREMNPEAKNLMFEDIFPPSVSSHQPELRKLKGDKKMAKVKPSSVKTHNELLSAPTENCKEIKQENTQAEIDLCADCGGIHVSNCSVLYIQDQLQCSPPQDIFVPGVQLPKMNSKTSKRSQKTTKKQKNPKKKTKNNKTVNGKMTSDSNSLESENVDSAMLPAVLESYVQNWLKNIFPNAAFPLLQMISSTKVDNNTTCVNASTCTQSHVNNGDAGSNANSSETHNDDEKSVLDRSLKDPDHKEIHEEKESLVKDPESFEDNVSVFMEKSKDIAELVAQSFDEFQHNNSYDNFTFEELFKKLASHQIMSLEQKKISSDVAIEVENDTLKKVPTYCMNGDYNDDVLTEQFNVCPQNINRSKKRHLEKSASLPNTPLKASPSSSPQLLLAWLIVLHLKQGMYHMVEDLSQNTNNFSAIFTLLQSLKKIAITENADDLKAAILHLQESVVRFDTAMKTLPDDFIPTQKYPKDSEESVQVNNTDADNTTSTQLIITESCEKPDLLRNDEDRHVLTDDMDDFRFFSTIPYRELSGEFCRNEANDNPEDCSLLGMHNNLNNESASSLDNVDQALVTDKQNSKEHPVDLSEKPSLKSDVVNGNVNMERSSASPKMVSKVKMMVQEMEEKKYSFCASEYPKSLQSPMSSDWSDYRPDSEDSGTLRASSEILTESGEEQIREKPFKTGFVKRAIERLYGKTETKIILPKTYVSPSAVVQTQPKQLVSKDNTEYMSSSQKHPCLSKESMSWSLSSPTKQIEDGSKSLKSLSVPLLEDDINHDYLISQKPNKGEVLIEKGRWLLKENHLLRRSPPEVSGMYGNLDTTSADTLLDNTSDDVPYLHPACKVSQPLAEVSSSELEDMAKPQTYTCHYFSMPHGSDSEPFNDTHSSKSKVRPKSSGGFVKRKTHYSLESVEKCGAISGSLPSFTTVDFNFSDNRVHPLPQSDLEKADNAQKPNSSCESRRQIQEQDSLDKLQLVCGQHCPILTALINHVNEKDRGFVYCSPYDIENQLLQSLLTDTTHSTLLKKCVYTDENNNIHNMNFINPMKSHNDSYTNIFFIFDSNNFAGINLLRNGSKDRQCLLNLFPVSWSAGLDSNENDENNNNLYSST